MSKPITRKVQALNEQKERVWITLESESPETLVMNIPGTGKLYAILPQWDEFISAAQRKHLNKLDTRPMFPHRETKVDYRE